MKRLAALLFLLVPDLAAAQSEPAVPEGLRGSWFQGDCGRPTTLLHLTARAAAQVPGDGAVRLLRFTALRDQAGWSIGTGRGAEAPRLLLRAAGEALETVEPDAKTRDDRLPGEAPIGRWQRCPGLPPALAMQHGEGLAMLAALEHMEAGCGGADTAACLGALVDQADVSGDGMLSTAELARLTRGAAWLAAMQEGVTVEALGAASGAGALAGLLAGRGLVESLDYDGDGKLSVAELGQDRMGPARPGPLGTAAGRPLRSDRAGPALDALRGLISGLGLLK
ncbi:MAG: hypothetical protein JWP04_1154 [Belnapia sp.]|nr:hypothetical protein [Belnapia sp.]